MYTVFRLWKKLEAYQSEDPDVRSQYFQTFYRLYQKTIVQN